ncbi:MAG: hypothetical protein LUD72_02750, partial [Bacteroidales bacterium]|nr:hypothetical protein [Bacteroidales bacterium]
KAIKISAKSDTDKLYRVRVLQPTPYVNKVEENIPLQMKGQDVFKFAVRAASGDITCLLNQLGMKADDVDYFMLHQANIRIINAIRDYMEQPAEKFPTNIEDHGNVSSAGCPILLDECRRKGMFKEGDVLAFSAFGAGLISAAAIMEW